MSQIALEIVHSTVKIDFISLCNYYLFYIVIYKTMSFKEEITNKVLQQLDTYHSPAMQHAVDWINEIFNNAQFKKNPNMYVANWASQRECVGGDIRVPEDIMLDVFVSSYCQ
jgi:hypothetical protein